MPNSDRTTALTRIRTAMIEKKMTQAELADAADCHEKTVQNLLNGRSVRDQTLFDVCMVLGLDFDEAKIAWDGGQNDAGQKASAGTGEVAPAHMGAYTKTAVEEYIGSYLTLRPAFAKAQTITAYRTDIAWSDAEPCLKFSEQNRPDDTYAHQGDLYIPATSMYIHFVSLTKGAMRMITASQLDQLRQMRGIITTLNKKNAQLVPVSAPIIYVKQETFDDRAFGDIAAGQTHFDQYRTLLDETLAGGYIRLIQPD